MKFCREMKFEIRNWGYYDFFVHFLNFSRNYCAALGGPLSAFNILAIVVYYE